MDRKPSLQMALVSLAQDMAYKSHVTVFERQNGKIINTFNKEENRTDGVNPYIEIDAEKGRLLIAIDLVKQLLPMEGGLSIKGILYDKPTDQSPLIIHVESPKDMRHVSELIHSIFAPKHTKGKPQAPSTVQQKVHKTYELGTYTTKLSADPEEGVSTKGNSASSYAAFGRQHSLQINYKPDLNQLDITCPNQDYAKQLLSALTMREVKATILPKHERTLSIHLDMPEVWKKVEKSIAHVSSKQQKGSEKRER